MYFFVGFSVGADIFTGATEGVDGPTGVEGNAGADSDCGIDATGFLFIG